MRTEISAGGNERYWVTDNEGFECGFFNLGQALDAVSTWSLQSARDFRRSAAAA